MWKIRDTVLKIMREKNIHFSCVCRGKEGGGLGYGWAYCTNLSLCCFRLVIYQWLALPVGGIEIVDWSLLICSILFRSNHHATVFSVTSTKKAHHDGITR